MALIIALLEMTTVAKEAPDSLARDWALVALGRVGSELLSCKEDSRELEQSALGVLADCAAFFTGEPARAAHRLLDDLI